jgi:hypothetical protein
MFKVEAVVTGDQLETLLLAAKSAGVTLQLGVHLPEGPLPRRKRKGKRSTKGNARPKRYKASMQIRLGPEPTDGPPKLIVVHRALRKEYGDEPFRKGDAKQVLRRRNVGGSSTSYMTKLLDRGSIVPAQRM